MTLLFTCPVDVILASSFVNFPPIFRPYDDLNKLKLILLCTIDNYNIDNFNLNLNRNQRIQLINENIFFVTKQYKYANFWNSSEYAF